MIHHPSILQNLNKFRVIKMLGFKTKELRGSARSCTELRGVDVEEGRTFSFCFVPSSRVAKVNRGPSLMGSTSGNESEIQSLVEKVQKRATEPRRLAQACAQFGRSRTQTARTGRGGDLVRSLTCVRPSNMPRIPEYWPEVAVVYPGSRPCPQ